MLPSITFTASPASIQPGQSSVLNWSASNATSVDIEPTVGKVALTGSASVAPAATTQYIAKVSGPGGAVTTAATVRVVSGLPTPGALTTGLGHSTLTCVDVDGDGFGTGPGCTGPDADDTDPNVHTTAEAVAKWGTIQNLMVRRGYKTVTSATRYWVLSTTGNDTTCASTTFGATPDPTTASPCATFAHLEGLIAAGDVVFWRGGTYTEEIVAYLAPTGTASAPIIYMSYPGELATIDNTTGADICAAGFTPQNRDYVTFDYFKFIYSVNDTDGDRAVNVCENDHLTLRHIEVGRGLGRGFFGGAGSSNWLIEYNVTYDQNLYGQKTHGMYIVNRSDSPTNQNFIVRNNIGWDPGRTCIQFSGPFSNVDYDGNVCYDIPFDSSAGFVFEQGVSHSFVRNNLCFNADVKCFNISDYSSSIAENLPHDQNFNTIENNTFVVPKFRWEDGKTLTASPVIWIGVSNSGLPCGTTVDLGHQTFRNNILLDKSSDLSGDPPIFFNSGTAQFDPNTNALLWQVNGEQDPRIWAATTTWENNDIYAGDSPFSGNLVFFFNTQTNINASSSTCGAPAAISGDYTWPQWTALNSATAGNFASDPLFTAYDDSFVTAPSQFDFRLQPGSPAVNSGVATDDFSDVLGMGRSVTPSLGAFQYPSGGTSIALNTWTSVPTNGATIGTSGWTKMIYVRNAKKVMLWGFYQESSTEPNQALGAYDFETNRWDILHSSGLFHDEQGPESGHNQAWGYDPVSGTILWHCCGSGSNAPENFWHTWEYDVLGGVGKDLQPSTPKPNMYANQQETATYDTTNNKFILFNGSTYLYDRPTNRWSNVTPNCSVACPGTYANASSDFDSANGKMYLFGGYDGSTWFNDVYTYDAAANTWTQLAPSGVRPAGRWKSGWVYDSRDNVFLLWGGETGNSAGILNDTWIFDPTANSGQGSWTQLSPLASPPNPVASPWESLVYDPDHNVFLLWLNDTSGYADGGTNACCSFKLWYYRYAGMGPSIGALSGAASQSTNALNLNSDGWADEPAVAGGGSTLYSAWSEMGVPTDTSTARWAHIYAKNLLSSTWSFVGSLSAYNSINSENSNGDTEAHSPSLITINGTPWLSYYSGKPMTTAAAVPQVYVRQWTGSAWSGGPIGLVDNAPGVYQSRSELTGVGTIPYIAFIENDKSNALLNQQLYVYVKHFNGSAWVSDGAALNRDSARFAGTPDSIATSVSAASDGTSPWVAWTEYTTDNAIQETVPQVYVSQWNGTAWNPIGGSLNQNATSWASDAAITFLKGQPYVAWVERTATGTAQLFVKTYSSGSWSLVGTGALNRTPSTGWAFRPVLANDGTNLYVGWVEQGDSGEKAQVYVDMWNGSAWNQLGSSLNADLVNGSAHRVSLAILNGEPVAAWGEVNYGAYEGIYTKQWTGSAWVQP